MVWSGFSDICVQIQLKYAHSHILTRKLSYALNSNKHTHTQSSTGPVVPGTDPRKTKGANGPARGSLLALRKGQGSPAAPADASVSAGGAQPPAPES